MDVSNKLNFENLIEFLDKNFYKLKSINILYNEKKIVIKMSANRNKNDVEFEFDGKSFKDVYLKIFNFVMEKFKKDGFYLVEKSDVFRLVFFYRFVKFCEKHQFVKNLYIIFENDENKMMQEMKELLDDYIKCEECVHVMFSNAIVEENDIIFEFRGFY